MKRGYTMLSFLAFLLGLLFIEQSQPLTGAYLDIVPVVNSLTGMILWIIAGILFIAGDESLEEKISAHWRKFPVNSKSMIEDIEQEYLSKKMHYQRSSLQKMIERTITKGKFIDEEKQNKKTSYHKQFYEGHAAQGGRVIDVTNHIEKTGKNVGKLIHFGQPANARYLWVVDEEGNFIAANRQTMQHEMPQMDQKKIDIFHRHHKLPHPTLAKGKNVFGSGEVVIEGGKIKEFNTASGHYINIEDVARFNKQGEEVFRYFIKKVGWKEVEGGARYSLKKE